VSVVNISENIYDTFTVIFLLLFLFSQAKMLSGIEIEKSVKRVYMFGIPAVLMALVTGIPGTVVLLSGLSRTSSFPVGLHIVNILFALYIISFLTIVSRLPAVVPKEVDFAQKDEDEKTITESDVQLIEAPKPEDCLAYLQKAYLSEEKFTDRVKSPFMQN